MFTIKTTDEYERWFEAIKDIRSKTRIRARLLKIEKEGHFGDIKSVGEGVYEMRFFFGSGYRIYYVHFNGKIIILLAGGDKSTQKRDIQNAINMAGEVK